jgi:vacuolar-type H+-ATPase subunit H
MENDLLHSMLEVERQAAAVLAAAETEAAQILDDAKREAARTVQERKLAAQQQAEELVHDRRAAARAVREREIGEAAAAIAAETGAMHSRLESGVTELYKGLTGQDEG